ncbi:MAG: DEAD/DEAH box helicase family protein [Candidatus Parcubacteria bacterium]|nr:DEAD/DEAH box helicase family protein [Candidatus Parcubacteria bacterium]
MDNPFLQHIQQRVVVWRDDGYKGIERETLNILTHIKRVGFLHKPQVEALETYIYLKEVVGNKSSLEVFISLFENEKDMLLGLGVSREEAFDLLGNKKKIEELMTDKFGVSDYPNQVYALTMGAGKTILMAVMATYDFVLSFYHPDDKRFAKNALVFAPDTTIIESLKEIKTFDYTRVIPKEYQNILLNIKYHYLESPETPLSPIGNYNIIVSNSQKIILKTRRAENNTTKRLFGDWSELKKKEIENKRLAALRELSNLVIFVDEAHHSYGKTLEGTLKKTRQTINYLHGNTPLVGVANFTGTPYINSKMIVDVVYHFGLKQGIEKGILKQVRFFEYSQVKNNKFLQDVIDKFCDEYGEKRLEGRLPKIAFYSASIDDLQNDLRPKLEVILANKGIPLDKILEYHTETEKNKDEFINCDTIDSKKQFILLVGKGTEGWNCRSLVACALYRKPKSAIFVLQSSTRCLRSIGDNSTIGSIFLSEENYRILDKELKNNFATTIEELSAQEIKTFEHTLKIEKKKKLKVTKLLKEILAIQNQNLDKIKIDISKFKPEEYKALVGEGGIFLSEQGQAGYRKAQATRELKENGNLTFYEIIELINRYTHLPCLDIEEVLEKNNLSRKILTEKINKSMALLPFVINGILANAYQYQEKTEIIEEEIELTKMYPFKISVEQGKNILVVSREQMEEAHGKSRIGFHINPYNFDSTDEKDLFKYLRDVLDKDEVIVDVYFTGGATDPTHNDFYFEYYSPENKRIARYFPDFLVETTKGRFLVVEVKSNREKEGYEKNKQEYKGKIENLFSEVFAKEIGFKEFQQVNKNFEYRIIFDASLQKRQQELLEIIKKNG